MKVKRELNFEIKIWERDFPSFSGLWYPANNICISLQCSVSIFYSIVTPSPQLGFVRSIDRLTTLATSMHILRQYPLFPPQGGNRFDSCVFFYSLKYVLTAFFSIFFITMCGEAVQNKCIVAVYSYI